ncbi:MAG: hypothetical protein GTO63_05795 [Anaerolineae bacterium]|nr:hypothetical protein [Anaerolineae bacterium]NIN94486.1 hypothetical protein [Anaerolineae bacterium]NIQ77554.1 hypothetical protein [Anaerolineae bacterium]
MPVWEAARHEALEYEYFVPAYDDVKRWVDREPTKFKVSVNSMKPGYICWSENKKDVWLCIGTHDMGSRGIDVHWIHWADGSPGHIQQVFRKGDEHVWDCAAYDLDLKPKDDYCPHCHIPLVWVAMAMKCPDCWYRP